ncbi:hypothetical protein [Anaerobiospirillum sp. NML120449]|uniref:hypothetical protein n=1 Tax=Anaerobiospirillum sp. NML120449 TaxID=2932817 RepID=UPI001FF624F2|nr:hypothetical protein [Anaerobiospirillum sp. NML120449]MCK0526388.1 hypothetical protein [Anaerobiospirillum sp. NML120449]
MDLRSRIEASYKRIAKEAYDKGYAEGFAIGFAIGYEEGFAEGFAIGYAEGFAIGYADSIKDIMDFRFGGMPDESLAALREINDVAVMRSIKNAAVYGDKNEVLNLIAQSRPA